MDLTNEINRNDKNKNNLKKAKNNIDNKLVELGGDASTNIFNVPEKIEKMSEEYLKYAYLSDIYNNYGTKGVYAKIDEFGGELIIPIDVNFAFIPKTVYLKISGDVWVKTWNQTFSRTLTNLTELEFSGYSFYNNDYILNIKLNVINEKKLEMRIKAKSVGSLAEANSVTIKNFTLQRGIEAFSKVVRK